MQKFWMGSISTPSLMHSRAFHSLFGHPEEVVTLWVVGRGGGGGAGSNFNESPYFRCPPKNYNSPKLLITNKKNTTVQKCKVISMT